MASVEWVQLSDDVTSKAYYWNRRTRQSVWKPPASIEVVWVGTLAEEGSLHWHKVTRVSMYWVMGGRVRGLASPSQPGCHHILVIMQPEFQLSFLVMFWRCPRFCS